MLGERAGWYGDVFSCMYLAAHIVSRGNRKRMKQLMVVFMWAALSISVISWLETVLLVEATANASQVTQNSFTNTSVLAHRETNHGMQFLAGQSGTAHSH